MDIMDDRKLIINNSINKNFSEMERMLNALWLDAKNVVNSGDYARAKEMILDGGAEVMAYLGEIVKKIDDLS
jgi:hypothetical protein